MPSGVQGRSRYHHRKDRPGRIPERTEADGRDRKARYQPFRTRSIDNGAAGHLPEQRDDPTDR